MKKRILTIQVEVTDNDKASWIWRNHLGEPTDNGVFVQAIRNGEIPEDHNKEIDEDGI